MSELRSVAPPSEHPTPPGPGPCGIPHPDFRENDNGEVRRISLPRTLVNKLPLLLDTCLQPYYATKITRLGDAPHRPHSYNARSKSVCSEGGREDGSTRIE
jgi:hypothetical protein